MSKVMSKINNAVMNGGKELEGFAKVSGMTGQEFARLWNSDPYAAIQKFEQGIKETNDSGQNYKKTLENLGITELRETDTVLRLANGNKQLADARTHANKGWKEGTALSTEAEQKYKSLGNQMKIFMNHVRALGIEIGSALAPILKAMMKVLTPVIDALAKAPAPIKLMVVALGLIPIVAVPVLASLAAITGAMGLMGQAMNTATFAAGRNSKALRIYSASMMLLSSPISTVKKGLMSIPGLFWKTGGAAKGSSGGMKVAAGGMLSLLNPMKLIRGILPALSLGFKGLLLAFRVLTGPIGLIVTGIVLLYKAFKSAYTNVEWFRKGIDGLVYVFKVFGGGIIGVVASKIKDLGNWFSKAGSQIKNGFTKNLKEGYNALGDDDLLKKGVNGFKGAMQVLGTASKKASDSTKVLGKGVSKETKGALGNYVKYSNSSNKILEQVKLNHGKISNKKATELLSIEDKLSNDLITKLEKRKQDELKNAQDVFENSKALSQKEKDNIIAGIEDRNNKAISKERELNEKIKQVKEEAMADGNISEKEMAQIEKLENQRRELTVKNLTKTEKEQDKILSRMKNNREALSISEASSAIKSAEKARKARIKEINDEYDDKVYAIDQMVGLSKEQKQKLLDEAEDEKKKQVAKANEKKEGVVKSVKDQNKDVESEMDTSNGKVYSNAEKWWNKTKEFFADDSLAQGFKKGMEGIGTWFSEQGAEFSKNFKEGWAIASQAGGDLWSWIKQTGAGIGGWFAQKGRDFWSALKNGWNNAITASGDIWSSIKQTGANIGGWFSQKGSQLWGSMKTGWNNAITTTGDLWNTLTTWLGSKWEITKQWFVIKGGNMWSSIKQGWNNFINMNPGALWTTLTSALGTAWEITKQWFITKGQQMGSALSQGWNTVKGFVVNTFNSIWVNVKMIWQGIWGTITYWTGLIWGRIKLVWTWIKNNTVNAFTTVWNAIKRIWSGIKNTIVYWTTLIWNRVKSVWGWIKSNTVGAFTTVWNTIKRIWAGIKGTIVYWTGAIWNRIKAVWGWIKSNTASAFSWVWNKLKSIWKGIKGTISYWTGVIWGRIKSIWTNIKNFTANIFNSVWGTVKRIWTNIKNAVIGRAKALWSGVRNTWNNLKKGTTGIFNSVSGFMSSKWNSIKSGTVNKAKGLWSGVKGAWGSLKKGTTNIMSSIGGFMSKKWNSIKNGTVKLVTGMKNKVTGVMNKMGDVIKSVTGKIGNFFGDMIKGVKKGLNKLIDGVNWVGGKLNMDKIKPIKLHTGTEHTNTTRNVVKNGKISRDTLATVGDKGRGNGPGGFRHEAIKYPNGKMALTPNRDTTAFLPKGSSVMNGAQTHAMLSANNPTFSKGSLPKFNRGTLSNKKPKKKKKDDNIFGDVWEGTKAGTKAVTGKVVEGGKAVVSKSLSMAAKGKKWMEDKIGDVMDWIEKPGKLLDKVLEGVGLNLDGFGISKAAELPYDMMKGMFGKLKKSAIDMFTSWMEDSAEGDGGYIDISKGINFPFSPHGRAPGYPFAGPHMGVDLNYKYDKLYSVLNGKATARKGWNGGFGNMVDIVKGATKVIYGHMSKHAFSGSKNVKPGDYLGVSGNSGRSSGPHLHFEVQKNGVPIDPLKWLKANDGGGSKKKPSAWGSTIEKAAKKMKVKLSSKEKQGIIAQIARESNGDAGVTQGNIGDINNRRGTPAQGLLQYVPSTFKSYAMKGHTNIKSGYDQLLAFFNNKNWRKDLPYGRSGWGPSGGRRYAHGGMIKKHGLYEAGEGNRPEMVLPLTNKVRAMQLIDQAKSFMGIDEDGSISTVQNNSTDSAMVQLIEQNNRLLEMLIGVVQDKELVVDKQAIVDTANNGLGRKHRNKKYTKGGY